MATQESTESCSWQGIMRIQVMESSCTGHMHMYHPPVRFVTAH